MMNITFTTALWAALNAALAGLLVVATVTDFRRRIITNRLNLTIAALAPVYWLVAGLPLWPGVPVQVGMALVVFGIFYIFFHFGGMGGGDLKLATALALWFAPNEMLQLVIIMSIAGGIITIAAWADHRRDGIEGRVRVPYGIAIALGGWLILAQRYLNHFG
ncbi:prepilin peptidase [Sphingomonas sp. KRR8]|uniref:A24 family peptidase n=1 Tax=Sphingomonas sp. KRR8 TaxID=2942996 RepID=UPI0020202D33|nr:prepilin peptidase [Sphingomonas sp. KRR8]URD61943.1 prepilin peptidase [Sphingomonas sp. KRR8]